MRILAAFDKCKDSLSAEVLCNLARERIKVLSGHFSPVPASNGWGRRFCLDSDPAQGGKHRTVKTLDALGRERTVRLGLLAIESLSKDIVDLLRLPSKGKIALIEMASVVGLADLKTEEEILGKQLRSVSGNASRSTANGVFARACSESGEIRPMTWEWGP